MENWLLPVCVLGLLIVSLEISKDQPWNLYFSPCLCCKTVLFQEQGEGFCWSLYNFKKAQHDDSKAFKSVVKQIHCSNYDGGRRWRIQFDGSFLIGFFHYAHCFFLVIIYSQSCQLWKLSMLSCPTNEFVVHETNSLFVSCDTLSQSHSKVNIKG